MAGKMNQMFGGNAQEGDRPAPPPPAMMNFNDEKLNYNPRKFSQRPSSLLDKIIRCSLGLTKMGFVQVLNQHCI